MASSIKQSLLNAVLNKKQSAFIENHRPQVQIQVHAEQSSTLDPDKKGHLLITQINPTPKMKRFRSIRGFTTKSRARFQSHCGGVRTPDNLMNLIRQNHVIAEASDASGSGSSKFNSGKTQKQEVSLGIRDGFENSSKGERRSVKKSLFFAVEGRELKEGEHSQSSSSCDTKDKLHKKSSTKNDQDKKGIGLDFQKHSYRESSKLKDFEDTLKQHKKISSEEIHCKPFKSFRDDHTKQMVDKSKHIKRSFRKFNRISTGKWGTRMIPKLGKGLGKSEFTPVKGGRLSKAKDVNKMKNKQKHLFITSGGNDLISENTQGKGKVGGGITKQTGDYLGKDKEQKNSTKSTRIKKKRGLSGSRNPPNLDGRNLQKRSLFQKLQKAYKKQKK